jgi:hypothetical protein
MSEAKKTATEELITKLMKSLGEFGGKIHGAREEWDVAGSAWG